MNEREIRFRRVLLKKWEYYHKNNAEHLCYLDHDEDNIFYYKLLYGRYNFRDACWIDEPKMSLTAYRSEAQTSKSEIDYVFQNDVNYICNIQKCYIPIKKEG